MKIYFIVTIDTECDKSSDWSIPYPISFRNITVGIPEKLHPLFAKYKIKPTYLLSPEVILSKDCLQIFKRLEEDFELGTHLHGEFIDPSSNPTPQRTKDYQTDYSFEVEREKILNLTNIFINAFEYRPESFRAGRFGVSQHTFSILQSLGYKVDSSIYPFNQIKTIYHKNNYYYFPVKPYYPKIKNLSDFNKQNTKILHVPITVQNIFFQNIPSFVGKPISNSPLILSLLRNIFGRERVKTYSLRPSTNSFEKMKSVAKHYLDMHKDDDSVFLHMMFHSNEIIPNASPYNKNEKEVEYFFERISRFFEWVFSQQATAITLKESYSKYQEILI